MRENVFVYLGDDRPPSFKATMLLSQWADERNGPVSAEIFGRVVTVWPGEDPHEVYKVRVWIERDA